MQTRLQKRLADLKREAQISPRPPVVLGGLLVVPRGLLDAMTGRPAPTAPVDTQTSAARARAIVMAVLGFRGACVGYGGWWWPSFCAPPPTRPLGGCWPFTARTRLETASGSDVTGFLQVGVDPNQILLLVTVLGVGSVPRFPIPAALILRARRDSGYPRVIVAGGFFYMCADHESASSN